MNENKKRSKAWPLAAAALALGLGGVVGASAVYADRADDAANVRPSQSVKMRYEYDETTHDLKLVVPFGTYKSKSGVSVVLSYEMALEVPSNYGYGNSVDDCLSWSNTAVVDEAVSDFDVGGYVFTIVDEDYHDAEYYCVEVSIDEEYRYVFVFQKNAQTSWRDYSYVENDEQAIANLNYVPKGLIGETFDAVAGGVTGVANTIGTSVTSVVGLFWDVENVRFTTLGTLTLVGLAAGLVYFAIRTIYRAFNGVA